MPAKSEKQRRYFAYLYSIKKAGKKSDKWKKASSKIKKAVDSMSSDTIHDFMVKEDGNISSSYPILKYFLNMKDFLGFIE